MNKTLVKRLILVLLAFCCLYLLSGCSFSDLMSWSAGVNKDPDYQTWERLSENGKLDPEGKYTADAVCVTFAENNFLDVKYYRDAEKQNEITEPNCYLLPGDFIYCEAEPKKQSEGLYLFDHLDVIEYSDQNERGDTLDWKYGEDGTILLVPYDYKGTDISIEPIGHFKIVTVRLEQPKVGGRVIYTANGEVLVGETAAVYCGTKIKGELEADTGWAVEVAGTPTYTVTEADSQVVIFDKKTADAFFSEKEDHKPKLKVDLHENLGSCRTTVDAVGLSEKDIVFDITKKYLLTPHATMIDGKKIGTADGITFTFSQFGFKNQGDNAVRITAYKRTGNVEYKEIRYADKSHDTIMIGLEDDITYREIYIVVEAVKTEEFQPIACEDADITAKFCDVNLDNPDLDVPIESGDLVTADRQIEVTIIPHDGFAIIGPFVNKEGYARKMRCDEYQRFVQQDLKNQLKKYCTVNLDTTDEYGTVEFRIGEETHSGETKILEGENITISYTLNNEEYEITNARDFFDQINIFDGNRFSKYVKTNPVTREMDGQTITREGSGINVRKKVN